MVMSSDVKIVEVDPSNPAYLAVITPPDKNSKSKLVPYFEITEDIGVNPGEYRGRPSVAFIMRNLTLVKDLDDLIDTTIQRSKPLCLVVPSEIVPYCASRGCEGCPFWLLCDVGDLPVGSFVKGRISSYHFSQRCITTPKKSKGDNVLSLTLHAQPFKEKEKKPIDSVLSRHKDLFFPQMRKDETNNPKDPPDV